MSNAQKWSQEYQEKGIPSSFKTEPSGSLKTFLHYCEENSISPATALDIGAGTGRNSLALAERGMQVTSVDVVPNVEDQIQQKAKEHGLEEKITPVCHDLGEPWPLEDAVFDMAFDAFCYKHLVTEDAHNVYESGLDRVTKPGSYFSISLAGIDDGYYKQFFTNDPEYPENHIIDPGNDVASILYTKPDLEARFTPVWTLVHYEHKTTPSTMYGVEYPRSTHHFIFRKK